MAQMTKVLLFLIIVFLPVLLTIRRQSGEDCRLLDFNTTNCLRGIAILLIMSGLSRHDEVQVY